MSGPARKLARVTIPLMILAGGASAGVTVEGLDGWFGSRPLIEDGSARTGPTSLVNARASYAFSKKTRLSLDVFNLFDRKDNDIDYF